MVQEYLYNVGIFIGINLILVMSLNLSWGFTGMINLGHAAFYGMGAYVSALLTLNGMPWYFAFLIAGIVSSILGVMMAATSARLKGDYLAVATLGFAFIAATVARNWISLTRGALGLPGVPRILKYNFDYMLFVFGTVLIIWYVLYKLLNSETGKTFQAIRDDEVAASILGKNVYGYKIVSMAIATFFAGIAGSLVVHYITFVDPTIFGVEFLIFILSALIIGGLGSLRGSIVGVVLLMLIFESARFITILPSLIGPLRSMIFSAALVIILIYKPKGLFGRVEV